MTKKEFIKKLDEFNDEIEIFFYEENQKLVLESVLDNRVYGNDNKAIIVNLIKNDTE